MPDMVTNQTQLIALEDRVEVTSLDPSWMILVSNPAVPKAVRRAFKISVANVLSFVFWALGAKQFQQARATTATDGTLTWTYPAPYPANVAPSVQVTPEVPAGTTDPITAVVVGTPTNTSAKIQVTRSQKSTITVLGVATVVLVPLSSPGATAVSLSARMPG